MSAIAQASGMSDEQPKRGRPSVYTEEIVLEIIRRVSCGETLKSVCRDEGMPSEGTVRGWYIEDREGFSSRYARARQAQAEAWADEIIRLSDECQEGSKIKTYPDGKSEVMTGDMIERSRLQVDTRKWIMARNHPVRFGDKITQEIGGIGGGPLEVAVHKLSVRDKVAALRAAAARPSG